jgi:hypothetical protein
MGAQSTSGKALRMLISKSIGLQGTEDRQHPYYILAPRYIRTSAGVRVLYKLVDLINRQGGTAFIFLWPSFNKDAAASPMDVAPFLTKNIVDYHFRNGLTPVVIYPEIVQVTKFDPPIRVRYMLNYHRLLAENESLDCDDYILSYSERISEELETAKPRGTLFIPVSDSVFYCPPATEITRSGGVYYAGKYKYRFGGKTYPITDGMPEITRDRPDSQTPEEIRTLFQNTEFFYCYEDSALAIEAILCGCPTVFLTNEHFKAPLGAKELAGLGYAVGTSPEQLAHARATVAAAREHYLELLDGLKLQVSTFIKDTQQIAAARPYLKPFAQDYLRAPGMLQRLIDLVRFIRDVIDDKGLKETLKIVAKRILARRFSI